MDVQWFTKKGMFVQTRLAYFVLILFVGLILFSFVDEWREKATDENKIEKCRASVDRNANLKIGKLRFSEELECSKRGPFEIGSGYSEERAKAKIAREMYICWRQFARGKLDLFEQEGVYCKICSEIKLKRDVNGLASYLIDNNVPGQKMSYHEYLLSFQGGSEGALNSLNVNHEKGRGELRGPLAVTLDKDETYYVVFMYFKGNDAVEKLKRQFSQTEFQVGYAAGSLVIGLAAATTLAPVTGGLSYIVLGTAAVGFVAANAIHNVFTDDVVGWLSFVRIMPASSLLGASDDTGLNECQTLL